MGVEVTVKGSLFDGTADQVMDGFVEEVLRETAQEGLNAVQNRLQQVLRRPTGRYRGKVITDRVSDERWDITDQGSHYGPWLEGTGSRNETSRFKGYQTFRKTEEWLQERAIEIADETLPRYLDEIGG